MHFQLVEPLDPYALRRHGEGILHMPSTLRLGDEKWQDDGGDESDDGVVEHSTCTKPCTFFEGSFGIEGRV